MNQHAAETSPPPAVDTSTTGDSLSQQVQGLIDQAGTIAIAGDERRSRDRFPIPYTFRLTPIDTDGNLLTDETTTIVGKDLSLTGIGFSHDHTLPYRRAIISLDHPKVGRFAVEAEIVWTRPTPLGLYESGCRLVRTLDGHTLRPNVRDELGSPLCPLPAPPSRESNGEPPALPAVLPMQIAAAVEF